MSTLENEINDALGLLRRHGYHITRPELGGETTLRELRRRTGLKAVTLHKRLHHEDCPPWSATRCGPSGRMLRLRVSAEALAYLETPLQAGRRIGEGNRALSPISLATT